MGIAVEGNPLRIPHYVSASDPKGLMREMYKNNLKHGCEFQYFDISKSGNAWYAWYYQSIDRNQINKVIKKAMGGE